MEHALNQEEQESAVPWGQEGTGGLEGWWWLLDLDLTEVLGEPILGWPAFYCGREGHFR